MSFISALSSDTGRLALPASDPPSAIPSWPALILPALLLVLLSSSRVIAAPVSAEESPVTVLRVGVEVRRSLTPGESHTYALPANEYDRPERWRLVIAQDGIDGVMVHPTPSGGKDDPPTRPIQRQWNSPLGRFDRETLLIEPFPITFEIRATADAGEPGHYVLGLEMVDRPLDSRATARLEGESLFTRACLEIEPSDVPMTEAHRRSAEDFETAAEAFGRARQSRQQGRALLAAAIRWRRLGENRRSEPLYRAALDIWRRLADPGFEALTLEGLGQLARRTGDGELARQHFETALALWRRFDRQSEAISTLGNLALLAQVEGDLATARNLYLSALDTLRDVPWPSEEANQRLNLASVLSRLGEADQAFEEAERSLELFRQLDDPRGEVDALNNLAVLHRRVGEPERALELYDRVRLLAEHLADPRAEGRALNNLGYSYLVLGQLGRAAEYFERALPLRRRAGDSRGEMATLHNLGQVEIHRRQLDTARRHLEAALDLAEAEGSVATVEILGRLGHLRARLGEDDSEVYFERAFRILDTLDNPLAEAELYYQRGITRLATSAEPTTTRRDLETALERWETLGDGVGQILATTALGRLEKSQGNLVQARHRLEAAIQTTETLREELANPDLRASFLGFRREAYLELIEVSMALHRREPRAGHHRRALEISETMHARSLAELLFRSRMPTPDTAPDRALLERRRGLIRRLGLVSRRRLLVRLGRSKTRGDDDLDQTLEDLRAQLDLVESRLGHASPRHTGFAGLAPANIDTLRSLLDRDTLLLHYTLGEERGFLFALGGERLEVYELPPRQELEALTRRVVEGFAHPGPTNDLTSADESTLARALLATVPTDFPSVTRLVVVGDGALHYLPFAALPLPSREPSDPVTGQPTIAPSGGIHRLVERFEIVQIPSAQTLALVRHAPSSRSRTPRTVAVLADPVFDLGDPRLAPSGGATPSSAEAVSPAFPGARPLEIGRLAGSAREAEIISRVVAEAAERTGGISPRLILHRGFEANREIFDRLVRDQAPAVLHLATHGMLDSENPELSSVVLAQFDPSGRRRADGFLRLDDIEPLDLPSDLVVLSGCRTALGRQVGGEGPQGLAGAFLLAGAEGVLASLWALADRATAEWMGHFYRAYLVEGRNPAAALRQAQLALASDRRFRHPYYWAPFILVGGP